eukprot:547481-Amphidinium_carterae.1
MCGFPYRLQRSRQGGSSLATIEHGRRTPKGRHRDLELRALQVRLPGQKIRWMKAHLKQSDVDSGRITVDDCQGHHQADLLANQGTAQHGRLEPDSVWLTWQDFAMKVYNFWRLVGPQLCDRPKEQPRVKLPTEPLAPPPVAPVRVPETDAPFQLGEHQRVVKQAGDLRVKLVACYLPRVGHDRTEPEKLHRILGDIEGHFKDEQHKILLGDLNAWLGRSNCGG